MNAYLNKKSTTVLVFFSLFIHFIFLFFSQSVDADATSRILIAERFIDSPEFITHGIWLPIHHYYNVLGILLTGEHLYGPLVLNIVLVSLTVIPVFKFTEREFGGNGAWFAACLYVLSPIIFRNTYFALSGIPFLFFVAWAINLTSKSIQKNTINQAIYAGLFMTIASGFRYEGWLMIAILTLIYFLRKQYKLMFYFWGFAMIFPAFWMIGNFIENGDLFSGLTGAYDWNIGMEGVNDHITTVDKLKRMVFFPISWFLIFSPFLVLPSFFLLFKKLKLKQVSMSKLIWILPFLVFFFFFIYKSFNGTLLNQHRFTQSLILLSVPFTAVLYDFFISKKWGKYYVGFILISMLPFSYLWMKIPIEKGFSFSYSIQTALKEIRLEGYHKIEAIPRLENQEIVFFQEEIEKNSQKGEVLILDFENWDNTFFLGINAPTENENLFILDGAKHGGVYVKELLEVVQRSKKGLILLNKASRFSDFYTIRGHFLTFKNDTSFHLDLKSIKSTEFISLFSFELKMDAIVNNEKPIFEAFSKESFDFKRAKIMQDAFWYRDLKYKVQENNTSEEIEFENAIRDWGE